MKFIVSATINIKESNNRITDLKLQIISTSYISEPVLFQNYPNIKNTTSLSLNDCGYIPDWPVWGSGLLTKVYPSIEKDCQLLWDGDMKEINKIQRRLTQWRNGVSDNKFLSSYLLNCSVISAEFNSFYVSQVEKEFPLAFLLNVHTAPQQIVRFIKAIYRPHNIYCIHVDTNLSTTFKEIIKKLSACLPNVIIPRKTYNIMYATIDQVDAIRSCYGELLNTNVQWKYAINLCGRELPLKTNRELVVMLKGMQNVNIVDPGVSLQDIHLSYQIRRRGIHKLSRNPSPHFTNDPLGPVPHNINLYKNNTFIAATREFVNFLLHDDKAFDFYLFSRDMKYADEQYFTSLNRLPEAPGGYHQLVANGMENNLLYVSVSYWVEGLFEVLPAIVSKYVSANERCYNKLTYHSVCLASCADLYTIKHDFMDSGQVMFFNKYFEDYDHVVMDCLEETLIEHNIMEFMKDCKLHLEKL